MSFNIRRPHFAMFDNNSLQAFIPALWAQMSVALLEENIVVPNLVNTDFSPLVAKFGDTINTRRPGRFTAMNKVGGTDVTVQAAVATNIQIPLNQHTHVSFQISDDDLSKSFLELTQLYLKPAVLALSRRVDRMLTGQLYQFLGNSYGGLGTLTNSNAPSYILGVRKVMDKNLAYEDPRYMIHSPDAETQILNNQIFQTAYSVGDHGEALKKAELGEKLGFTHYKCQNAPSVLATTQVAGAVNYSAGYAVGTTSMVVDSFPDDTAPVAGNWFNVVGSGVPHQILTVTIASSAITGLTFTPGLAGAVVNDAVITVNTGTTVNGAQLAGYGLPITVTSTTNLNVGQFVTFNTDTNLYSITEIAPGGVANTIQLDRPLVNGIGASDTINPGPNGTYSFAFHPNAVTWVVRPLALPPEGTGVRAGYASLDNGMTVRITMQYQALSQGMLVTLDFLTGLQILDSNLGAVLLG